MRDLPRQDLLRFWVAKWLQSGSRMQVAKHGWRQKATSEKVRAEGLEPPSPCGHRDLNPARLPVSPRSPIDAPAVVPHQGAAPGVTPRRPTATRSGGAGPGWDPR